MRYIKRSVRVKRANLRSQWLRNEEKKLYKASGIFLEGLYKSRIYEASFNSSSVLEWEKGSIITIKDVDKSYRVIIESIEHVANRSKVKFRQY